MLVACSWPLCTFVHCLDIGFRQGHHAIPTKGWIYIKTETKCPLASADINHQIVLDDRKIEAPYEQKLKRTVINLNKHIEIRQCLILATKDTLWLWAGRVFEQAGPFIHLYYLV
uniref:Uncharacterized protein n=1 Tax=Micrurus paraensis TaxID=1970185 RepID=A0A2D4K0C2_9SAUR